MKITLIALGKWDDVQPFVALALGLKNAGYETVIATSAEFGPLINQYEIGFHSIGADPEGLEQTETGRSVAKEKAVSTTHITTADDMSMMRKVLDQSWQAAQGTKAVIYNPAVLAGYHILEKLKIPGFIGSPLPVVTPTDAFPNPSIGTRNFGRFLNKLSYSLSRANTPYLRTINKWRAETLGLKPRSRLADNRFLENKPIPVLYCYSAHVIPYPKTWPPATFVTGYWLLRKPPKWEPPASLVRFLQSGPMPVYVGFTPVKMNDPKFLLKTIVDALKKAGLRGVVSIGSGVSEKTELPETVYSAGDIPHSWVFPQVDVVVHQGGAGTSAAAFAAGKPSIVCPYDSHQFFWAKVVEDLGLGPKAVPLKKVSKDSLSNALLIAISDEKMRRRAVSMGESIRAENGIQRAIQVITNDIVSRRFPQLCGR